MFPSEIALQAAASKPGFSGSLMSYSKLFLPSSGLEIDFPIDNLSLLSRLLFEKGACVEARNDNCDRGQRLLRSRMGRWGPVDSDSGEDIDPDMDPI